MNKKLASVKKFYVRNERKILIATSVVGITGTVLMRSGIKEHNDFLKEKGLFEEFYRPEES
jgi:hypothetical protein